MTLKNRALVGLLALLALSSVRCTSSPYTGWQMQRQDEVVDFNGYVPWPNALIEIQGDRVGCGGARDWQTFATTTSAPTEAMTDDCGVKWYPWRIQTALPQDTGWCDIHYHVLQFNARAKATINGFEQILVSFPQNFLNYCQPNRLCGLNLASCGQSDGEIDLECTAVNGCRQ